MYGLKTDWAEEPHPTCAYALDDYASDAAPRWCPGCGDHAVLTSVQKLLRDEQLPPEQILVVSGIGCSSRFPHYMGTYGFHSLHGRALPVAEGARSRRPDLHIIVVTGDGDCTSIGAGHWVHAIRYNMKMTVLLFDNNVYGLTKNQTSPTSHKGQVSNTHPRGAWLDPLDPLQVALGITNVSFVAQTIDWNPRHMGAVLSAAHHHPGLSFVRIRQRCPHYVPHMSDEWRDDPNKVMLLNDRLEYAKGITRRFKNQLDNDASDIHQARELASRRDVMPIGLLYQDADAPVYSDLSTEGLATSRSDKLAAMRRELDHYRI